MTQMSNQASNKSSKYFKEILFTYQRILLVESSIVEYTPAMLNNNSMEFIFNAQIMLHSLFGENKLKLLVTPAVATIFLYGSFI